MDNSTLDTGLGTSALEAATNSCIARPMPAAMDYIRIAYLTLLTVASGA
jgi:hypothetical protein